MLLVAIHVFSSIRLIISTYFYKSVFFMGTVMKSIQSHLKYFLLALIGTTTLLSTHAAANVDPNQMVSQFEATGGKFEGYRRSGAKGICATGEFTGSAEGRKISNSSAFSGKKIPMIVRFSVGGGNPNAADNAKTQRNMALQFTLPNNEVWQMGNISVPVFGSATPEQLLGRLQSLQPDPATKAADPVKVKAFADANPEVLIHGKFLASQPVPASYATVNYWGVHGFSFANAKKEKVSGKWVFEPADGTQTLTDEEAKLKGPNFLFDDLRQRVAAGKVSFNFNLEIAQAGDILDNATVPLPAGRKKITLGALKITSISSDGSGPCLSMTFDPNIMPKGVEGSADPMLGARTVPYAISLGRRVVEGAKQ
ncbi:catalase family peroxidase [Polynucleobacter antarcticus]